MKGKNQIDNVGKELLKLTVSRDEEIENIVNSFSLFDDITRRIEAEKLLQYRKSASQKHLSFGFAVVILMFATAAGLFIFKQNETEISEVKAEQSSAKLFPTQPTDISESAEFEVKELQSNSVRRTVATERINSGIKKICEKKIDTGKKTKRTEISIQANKPGLKNRNTEYILKRNAFYALVSKRELLTPDPLRQVIKLNVGSDLNREMTAYVLVDSEGRPQVFKIN